MSRREILIRRAVAKLLRWHLVIIAATLVVGMICGPRAVDLYRHIDTDMGSLLPDHFPSIVVLKRVRDKFRAMGGMILVLEAPTPQEAVEALTSLGKELEADSAITRVEYEKRGFDFFDRHKLLYRDLTELQALRDRLDRRIQREKLGPLFVPFDDEKDDGTFSFPPNEGNRYYTSGDQRVYSLYLKSAAKDEGLLAQQAFYDYVQGKVHTFQARFGNPHLQIYFTGPIRTRVEDYQSLMQDLLRAGVISGIGILLVLLVFFRRPFAVGMLLLPLGFSIVVSLALASFLIDDLNLITSFLFAILGGLGIEVGIHMLSRYLEARRDGKEMNEALFEMLSFVGGPALTSTATVAATFFILLINDFKGFSEFGLIAGMGLVVNYVCYLVVFPSLVVLFERRHLLLLTRPIGFKKARHRPLKARFPCPSFILVGTTLFVALAVMDLPRVGFEWRFSKLKATNTDAALAKQKQRLTSSTVNSPAVVIIHNKEEALAVKAAVANLKHHNAASTLADVRSSFDFVPDDQVEKLVVLNEIDHLFSDPTLALVKNEEQQKYLDRFRNALKTTTLVKEGDVPQEVYRLFWGEEMNPAEQVLSINPLPHLEMDDGRNAIRFAQELGTFATRRGILTPSSDAIVFADVLTTLIRDGKRAIVLAFFCVSLLVYADVRRLRTTLLIVSPIVLGVLFTCGLMYVFRLKLNFFNMVVIPIGVGTSIDNAIHLYHRYEEGKFRDLMGAWSSSGAAALLSSATNIMGFLGLVFVNHEGLRSIGFLAIATMAACLFTTLVFFPALLQFLEDRRRRATLTS